MKKIFVVMLMLMALCTPIVFAESAAAPVVTVDLTGAVVALVRLVFYILLAWLGKVVVPELREWLQARTTAEQRAALWDVVVKLVEAAEQLFGAGVGDDKREYVASELRRAGYSVDFNLIEAAVKEMNDKALDKLKEGFEAPAETVTEG